MNDIICAEEENGGIVRPSWPFRGFQNFIDECGLVDLGFSGYPSTWRNNRHGVDYVQERLDRFLVTPSWHLLYGQASVTHVETVGSNHNAILLNLHTSHVHSRIPFHFDGRWVDDDEVEQVIHEAWTTPVQGSKSWCTKRFKLVILLLPTGSNVSS